MMKRVIFYLFVSFFFISHSVISLADNGVMLNQLDIEYGDAEGGSDEKFLKFSGSVYGKLFNHNYFQIGLGRTHFDNADMNELDAYYIHRSENSMLALGYKRQELDVFRSNHAIVQYQFHQDDLLTIVATLGHEDKNINYDHSYGALYLRLYPYENLMVQTGPRFNDTFKGDFGSEDIELDLYIEWRPDIEALSKFSFYFEENIFNDTVVGIRYRLEKQSLREIHRTGGILGI